MTESKISQFEQESAEKGVKVGNSSSSRIFEKKYTVLQCTQWYNDFLIIID